MATESEDLDDAINILEGYSSSKLLEQNENLNKLRVVSYKENREYDILYNEFEDSIELLGKVLDGDLYKLHGSEEQTAMKALSHKGSGIITTNYEHTI